MLAFQAGKPAQVLSETLEEDESEDTLDFTEDEDTEDGENSNVSHQNQAKFIILEPKIMISTTNIVNSFPCVRKSLFSDTFRNTNGDFSYPLVIGNIIHDSFESII